MFIDHANMRLRDPATVEYKKTQGFGERLLGILLEFIDVLDGVGSFSNVRQLWFPAQRGSSNGTGLHSIYECIYPPIRDLFWPALADLPFDMLPHSL